MRIRWRGLELPSRVTRDQQVSTDTYAKFIAEPFERGFGTTVGNAMNEGIVNLFAGTGTPEEIVQKMQDAAATL